MAMNPSCIFPKAAKKVIKHKAVDIANIRKILTFNINLAKLKFACDI